jgi:hypothetical protein
VLSYIVTKPLFNCLYLFLVVDFRKRFEDLLNLAGTRPRPAVMERLQRFKETAILTAGTAFEAQGWYEWAKNLPQTVTRDLFHNLTGYQLDAGGRHPNINGFFLAGNDEGLRFMFKTVKEGSEEAFAATKVCGGPFLVGSRFERVEHAEDDGSTRVFEGLLMHKYDGTLQEEGNRFQLSPETLLKRTKAMILAVNHIHLQNLVHMDIKDNNIFAKDGLWCLGDFGSCVIFKDPITSTSHPLAKKLLHEKTPSSWKYDWYMLCMVITRQFNVHVEFPYIMHQIHDAMVELINRCPNVELQSLLTFLLESDAKLLSFDDMESFEKVVHTVE